MQERIGFIGLGAMGGPVAARLAAHGWKVTGFDTDRARAAAVRGIELAGDPAGVVAAADILFTCLPNEPAVEAVLGAVAKPGLLLIDLSTIRPTTARRLHDELKARGVAHVECPMLKGAAEAAAGTLFLIVSGEPQDVERLKPFLPLIGSEHRIVGGPGAASRIKTVQNGLGLVQMCAIAEALAMIAADGGDLGAFIEVVGAGGGMAATPLFRAKAPLMRDPNAKALGSLHIGAKDSALAADLATDLGLDLPLFERSALLYRRAMAAGLAHADVAAVARMVETETGVQLAKG